MIECAGCQDVLSENEDLELGHFALCMECDGVMARCKHCGQVLDWQGAWTGTQDEEITEMARKGLLLCPGCDRAAERGGVE